MAFGDMPQPMQMMPLQPMPQRGGAAPGGMGAMGMKILQAALGQQQKDQATLAGQPQVGATMPGGAMNITPPTLPARGGFGLLSGLFGRNAGGGGLPTPMDSTNALY